MSHGSPAEVRVLHVDDDPEFAEVSKLHLERESDTLNVVTVEDGKAGLDRLREDEIDCVVSDYNMPGMNGIEFLERVRAEWPDKPFILFTGKGSEEIASEAISAGVTDYLQKQGGADQYTVLANRIENAVAQYRTEQEIEETTKWYSTILEHSSDYVMIVDGDGTVSYVSPAIERVMGYDPETVIDTDSFEFIHPDDLEDAAEAMAEVIENPDRESTVEFRAQHAEGSWRWLETRGRNLLDDPIIDGVMVNVRDITTRKRREQELEYQRDRLQDLSSFITHDVRNQIHILQNRLELATTDDSDSHIRAAMNAVDRINEMLENIMELAQGGHVASDPESVRLSEIAEDSWQNVKQANATLVVESDTSIRADDERARSLLENLFLNATQHGGDEITIRVGVLSEERGFYVADDGPGIPPGEADRIFDSGYSTGSGTGLGLAIVEHIAETHGWSCAVTESDSGGARFEFTGVESGDDAVTNPE